MDKFNYMLALMRDLSRGKRRVEYPIADGGRLRRYVLASIGEERIETALGTFDAIVVRRERGRRQTADDPVVRARARLPPGADRARGARGKLRDPADRIA